MSSTSLHERPQCPGEPVNEILEPTTLILDGTTIHAESTDLSPFYRLSRDVTKITQATKEVDIERIEQRAPNLIEKSATKPRSRHIFTIKYMVKVPGGIGAAVSEYSSPRVSIHPASRHTLGHYGAKRSKLGKKLEVLPIDMSNVQNNWGIPKFRKDGNPLFRILEQKDGTNAWLDGDKKQLAVEERSEGRHKLIIKEPLRRETVDAMVALWCGRIWQFTDEHAEPIHEGMEGGELHQSNEFRLLAVADSFQCVENSDWQTRFARQVSF